MSHFVRVSPYLFLSGCLLVLLKLAFDGRLSPSASAIGLMKPLSKQQYIRP
jgi:hypothetical protein